MSQLQRGDQAGALDTLIGSYNKDDTQHEVGYPLALLLTSHRRFAEALPVYQRIFTAYKEDQQVRQGYAMTLKGVGQHGSAIEHLTWLLDKTLTPELLVDRAFCFERSGDLNSAERDLLEARRLSPQHMGAGNALGLLLAEQSRLEEAEVVFQDVCSKVVKDQPNLRYNYGNCLLDLHRPADAIAQFDLALNLEPAFAEAAVHRAQALLLSAQSEDSWEKAWSAYESRWNLTRSLTQWPGSSAPRWDGKPGQDTQLLVYGEQGLGDAIQFARFLPLASEHAGQTTLQVSPPLVALLKDQFNGIEVISFEQKQPEHNASIPLMSLPGALGLSPATAPNSPYIAAPTPLTEHWVQMLTVKNRPRIGLAWAAFADMRGGNRRTCDFPNLELLSTQTDAAWVSLQKQIPEGDLPLPSWIMDFSKDLTDFKQTAALIANLDLVITVDTAVAHLAGAMGKPVHILLPYGADWRWALNRSDSDWYPTATLYRQKTPGDWKSAVDQLIKAAPWAEFSAQ